MNKKYLKISALYFVGISLLVDVSEVRSMQPEDEVQMTRRTPHQELIEVINECSVNGKTTSGSGVEDNNSFQAFASMCQETTNYYEPEDYLRRLNNNTMMRKNWLDLVEYLNTKRGSIKTDLFDRILQHARSFAYIPFEAAH